MLIVPAPDTLDADLLASELAAVGAPTSVSCFRSISYLRDEAVEGTSLMLAGLTDADLPTIQPVLDEHPGKAAAAQNAEDVQEANGTTLRAYAETAHADNKTFLAVEAPSNAQLAAQVKALTRMVNGLIRLALGKLDATD